MYVFVPKQQTEGPFMNEAEAVVIAEAWTTQDKVSVDVYSTSDGKYWWVEIDWDDVRIEV